MDNHLQLQTLKIDEEFKTLLAPLTSEEFEQLETNIKKEGCREPLSVWHGIIVDGHNRYNICHKHNIPFLTHSLDFANRDEAIAWICANQLGRRNISEETKKYLIGKKYEIEKMIGARNSMGINQHTSIEKPTVPTPSHNKTASEMAKQYSLSHSTIYKYGIYSKYIDILQAKCPEITEKILAGNIKASHENIVNLSRLSKNELYSLLEHFNSSKNGQITYADIRHELQWKNSRKGTAKQPIVPQQELPIKQIPKFDPDAEISSLSLTIPSWISSIERTQKNTLFGQTTLGARQALYIQLENLRRVASNLLYAIKEEQ